MVRPGGIPFVGDWSPKRVLSLMGLAALVFLLYGWKKQGFWPFVPGGPLYAWTSWQPSMWFGLLYSTLITGFGVKAILRYRRDPYQVKRYMSLILSQILLFWVIPEIIFQMFWPVEDGWRAYGLFFPAPLYVWNFWAPQDAHVFWFAWSIVISVAGVPLMAKLTGKKYCAFVCSCGGLAETLGDGFRTLSPRGRRMRAWENLLTYTVTVLVAMVIAFGLANKDSGGWKIQGLLVDFLLAGAGQKIPLLQFNRSAMRAAWFKRNYPGVLHVYLLRDPRQQFRSFLDLRERGGRDIFLLMNLLTASNNRRTCDFFRDLSRRRAPGVATGGPGEPS